MTDTEKRITVNKWTIIYKILDGLAKNGCEIHFGLGTGSKGPAKMTDIIEPLVKYLERKGIEVR